MSIRRAVLVVLVLGLVGAGCAIEQTSPPPVANVPLACIDVEATLCNRVVAILEEHAPGAPMSYLTVAPSLCRGCPGDVPGAFLVDLTVEFADGRPPSRIAVGVDGPDVTWQPLDIEGFLVLVEPASEPVLGPFTEFALGHCGLNSPIDLDGSLWDPVGMIDQAHPDLINGVRATFNLTSPVAATLRTEGGAVVQLLRHDGARHYPGCD